MADDTDRPKTNLIEMLFSLGYQITKKTSEEPFDPRKLKFKPVTPSSSSVSRPGLSSVSSSVSKQTNSVSNANPNLTPAGAASTSAARPVNRFESQPATKRPSAIANNLPSTASSSSTRTNVVPSKTPPIKAPPSKAPSKASSRNVPSNRSAASRSYIPNEFDEMLNDNFMLDELPITEEECFKKDLLKSTVRASSPIKPSAGLINRSSTITSSSVAQPSTSKRARPIDNQTPAKKARLGHEEVLILSDSELISLIDDEDLEEFLPAKKNVNNSNGTAPKNPPTIRSKIDQNNSASINFIINEANRDLVTASLLDCDLDEDIDVESQGNENRRPVKSSLDVARSSVEFTGNYRNDGIRAEFKRMDHRFSRSLIEQLDKTFGLKEFRLNQFEAMNAIMLKRDCFVLMPTGGGKSICYQLPAVISGGITIVVSPLISLIKDQVQKLNHLGVVADTFTVGAAIKSERELYDDLTRYRPTIKLLYLTPEKISISLKLQDVLKGLYDRGLLDRLVIDEAHCISQWGHDFRPDYKKLVELRVRFPDLPIMALTATATPRVREDILKQLKMVNTVWFLQSFNRPNLKFEVKRKNGNTLNEILEIIKMKFYGTSGIIYCLTRNDCEKVAKFLCAKKIPAKPYHAGLEDELRKQTQEEWLAGRFKLVCATIAFGMGIDKSDVRYVFHYNAPWSLEAYYQEAGRAGRDGLPSYCYLYYSYDDIRTMYSLIAKDEGDAESRKTRKGMIKIVKSYCTDYDECRRVRVLRYFGEVFDAKNCSMNRQAVCDNCENRSKQSHGHPSTSSGARRGRAGRYRGQRFKSSSKSNFKSNFKWNFKSNSKSRKQNWQFV